MNHFLEISQLSLEQIECLLERALRFKLEPFYPSYASHTLANLFYEHSTRTRVSFEMAAKRLSLSVINLDVHHSSENKGETLKDTIKNLAAMGIHYIVLRHKQEGLQQELANALGNTVSIINAGDGVHAHPSQALLDIMTIKEQKPDLTRLKIAVVGNIRHSRVANSFQIISKKLGVGELVFIAPELWQPNAPVYGCVTDNLQEGLADADVIICLRVQKERLSEVDYLDLESYRQHFAVTKKSVAYAKPNAMVMHPGPINRGIEIDSEVADGAQSFILQQVTNGVFARMAILDALVQWRGQ